MINVSLGFALDSGRCKSSRRLAIYQKLRLSFSIVLKPPESAASVCNPDAPRTHRIVCPMAYSGSRSGLPLPEQVQSLE